MALLVGTSIAQAVPIAISPVLTRLYTPKDLGVLALFMAVTGVAIVVANGGYELAIMLPADERDALNIAALAEVISVAVSFVLGVSVLLFRHDLASFLGNAELANWLLLAPIVVLFTATFNCLNYFVMRTRDFRAISRANITRALVGATTQVGVGAFANGAGGLIIGQTLSSAAANVRLARRSALGDRLRAAVTWKEMRNQALTHRDFPKYAMSAGLANALAQNIGNILLSFFYSLATLGHYSLVRRVLGMPLHLLGNAVGQVFYQSAIEEKRLVGNARGIFLATAARLLGLAVVIFLPAFFLIASLFHFLFGPAWQEAGLFAQILVPAYALRFIVLPLTWANPLNMKNSLELSGNVLLLAVTVFTIVTCGKLGLPAKEMLVYLTAAQCVYYVTFLWRIYAHVARRRSS